MAEKKIVKAHKIPTPNNVKVRIRSESTRYDVSGMLPDGENESVEFVTEGLLRESGGLVSLTYEESREIGMGGVSTTFVFPKNDRKRLSLLRKGFSPVSMVFDLSHPRHICAYTNDDIPLEFCIFTREVKNSVEAGRGGKIYLDYDVEIHGFRAERNRMSLSLLPVARPSFPG